MQASGVSAQPCVRAFLLDMQRQLARTHNVVMDGRDIGTVVLPKADVKIFLTASAEVRAKRRFDELQQKGDKTPYAQILAETKQRLGGSAFAQSLGKVGDDVPTVKNPEYFADAFQAVQEMIGKGWIMAGHDHASRPPE